MAYEYGVLTHSKSGERYAIMMSNGLITQAAGPLHYSEGFDKEDVEGFLFNQSSEDLEGDAQWLRDEIAAHGEMRVIAYQ